MNKIILGHRGYSEIAPENTKLAFDQALLSNFDGLEIDLHMTKDRELVVIHDETIDRTSNGKGKIGELNLKELKLYKYNQGFSNIEDQNILTYNEFLELYGNKCKYINVEIKTDIIHYEGIEELILKETNNFNPSAEIIFSSFHFKTLEILRSLSKDAKIGFLFVSASELKVHETKIKSICNYIHPWMRSVITKVEYEYYKKINLPINLWTVDKRETGNIWTHGSFAKLEFFQSLDLVHMIISNSKLK